MNKAIEPEKGVDILSQNYNEMNENGKDKLKEVSEKLFEVWTTVHGKAINNEQ